MLNELKKQTKLMEETLKWMKVGAIKEVKQVLIETLDSDTKKLIYHHSNGIRGTQDFKDVANVKRIATISDCWRDWKRLGILEGVPVKGGERGRKLFNLEDFEIPIPEIKQSKERISSEIPESKKETEEVSENGL